MDVNDILMKTFEENGVFIEDADAQLNIDSIQYISILADMEAKTGIGVKEELLIQGTLLTYNDFLRVFRS